MSLPNILTILEISTKSFTVDSKYWWMFIFSQISCLNKSVFELNAGNFCCWIFKTCCCALSPQFQVPFWHHILSGGFDGFSQFVRNPSKKSVKHWTSILNSNQLPTLGLCLIGEKEREWVVFTLRPPAQVWIDSAQPDMPLCCHVWVNVEIFSENENDDSLWVWFDSRVQRYLTPKGFSKDFEDIDQALCYLFILFKNMMPCVQFWTFEDKSVTSIKSLFCLLVVIHGLNTCLAPSLAWFDSRSAAVCERDKGVCVVMI